MVCCVALYKIQDPEFWFINYKIVMMLIHILLIMLMMIIA